MGAAGLGERQGAAASAVCAVGLATRHRNASPALPEQLGGEGHLGEDYRSLQGALGRETPAHPSRARARWPRRGWAARRRRPPGPGAAAGAAPGSHGRRQVLEPRAGSPQSRADGGGGGSGGVSSPSLLPFPPGSGLPARRVSGSQVSAPTCAPSARPATFPATETSQLGAPAPPRRCSQRPGSVLRPRPLSLQPRLEAGAPRVLGFPDPRRSSSSARPAGTLASERRRRQNWESRADGLGTSPRPGARSPPAGSKV